MRIYAVMMQICNYILSRILPTSVYLGFDSHLLLEFLSSHTNEIILMDRVMAKTIEKFISFRIVFRSVEYTHILCIYGLFDKQTDQ